eukprot:305112-Pyramimonas_sp.AAC.1
MCILAGDFNFYAAGEQREYLAGHLSQPQESSTYGVRAHFDAVFAKFLEVEQTEHTQHKLIDGAIQSVARLD